MTGSARNIISMLLELFRKVFPFTSPALSGNVPASGGGGGNSSPNNVSRTHLPSNDWASPQWQGGRGKHTTHSQQPTTVRVVQSHKLKLLMLHAFQTIEFGESLIEKRLIGIDN